MIFFLHDCVNLREGSVSEGSTVHEREWVVNLVASDTAYTVQFYNQDVC